MENNHYFITQKNRRKQLLRIRLGFFQFVHKPVLNLLWLFVVAFTVVITILKNEIVEITNIPQLLSRYSILP